MESINRRSQMEKKEKPVWYDRRGIGDRRQNNPNYGGPERRSGTERRSGADRRKPRENF
jgi:hypothetical protein